MGIHVFLWRSHRNTNRVFRLVNPVHDINTYVFVFKVSVFAKESKYYHILFFAPRIQHTALFFYL